MRGYLHLCDNECLKIMQIHIHPHLRKCRDTSKFITCTYNTNKLADTRGMPRDCG